MDFNMHEESYEPYRRQIQSGSEQHKKRHNCSLCVYCISFIVCEQKECRTKAPRTKAPGHIFHSSFNTLLLGKKISVSESGTPFHQTVALFLCS